MGGADASRTVWRVADNWEKTLLCKFLLWWAKFLKLDTYWASEASPTLGCSIEISRDIYVGMYVCLSYVKSRGIT